MEWIEHTGVVGGWPTTVKTYWEGRCNNETKWWISPLSNKDWHLISAGQKERSSIRGAVDELKRTAESLMTPHIRE